MELFSVSASCCEDEKLESMQKEDDCGCFSQHSLFPHGQKLVKFWKVFCWLEKYGGCIISSFIVSVEECIQLRPEDDDDDVGKMEWFSWW